MTALPEKDVSPAPESPVSVYHLEELFYLGSSKSDDITVFNDADKGIHVVVRFRTLRPFEIRQVYEAVGKFDVIYSQEITRKIETLARAIVAINGHPLLLAQDDIAAYTREHNREPTMLDQARSVLTDKIQSQLVIEALHDEYNTFLAGVTEEFENIKKK